ncbi:hypothetical protein G647_07085 [Cladophialophora carrionii CBS 160.54]|uniref:Cytochrome P450 monooxygenase n=1 Tax=Cladophialophora carrionii CBS 160.54 TaxID=1279043 RepID=V9D373_9EURO|nr:uncharacterized protein G647_07085 [Cladophialophora carrionii CBS 160.54]ETI20743.1 hypothetical protein G647_07085 [Cladophialophora carrionii CBS 160.54]
MHYWRGVITHLSIVLAQPTYLATRHCLGHVSLPPSHRLYFGAHVAVWVYIVARITIPFFRSPLRRLPSPPGEKFLLCHLNFNGGQPPTTIVEDMVNSTPNDGLLVVWLPLYLSCEIIPTRPDTLMDMLNSHNYDWEKPPFIRKVLAGILGEGLANVEGAKHKAMRRVVAPAFSGRHIRELTPLFYSKGLTLADVMARLVRDSGDGVLDVTGPVSRAGLDIIGAAGVGMDFNTIENETSLLAKLYQSVTNAPAFFLLVSMLLPRWLLQRLKGTGFARTIEAQSQLHDEIRSLMQEKKVLLREEKSAHDIKDIIASIMRAGDFSDDYLVSQMLTFLAAGHDTVASALSWALMLLSQHPQVQDRLRAECNANLAHIATAEVGASAFEPENMPFLTAVCNETLRLYPPAPSTARHAVVDTSVGGVPVPKGTTATISPWAINRSRALWGADAAEFKPDRWLEEHNAAAGGAESPYAFLTFLHGPRSCIGQSFARLEVKCLLAALVTRFRFEMADPGQKIKVAGFVTIKPQGGLRLKVRDLEEAFDGTPAESHG